MKTLYSITMMMFLTTMVCGQVSNEDRKLEIKNVVVGSFDEIWSELDSKNINKYYTKDFLLLENGEVWNNDSIKNYLDGALLRNPDRNRVNRIEVIDTKVSETTAWIAYHNYATFTVDNKVVREAHWLESATAIMTASGWKLDMLHSTRMED